MARRDVTEQRLNFGLWRKLAHYIWDFRKSIFWLGVVMILFAIVEACIPLLTKFAIDSFIEKGTDEGLGWYLLGFGLVAFFRGFLVWIMIWIGGATNYRIVYTISRDTYNHLQKLPVSFFDKNPTGWLMSRVTSDCRTLGNTLSWGVVDIVWGLFLMVLMAGIMLALSWKTALIVMSIVPVLLWFSVYYKERMLSGFRKVREVNSTITGAVNESILGVQTTKTLVREDESLREFRELNLEMTGVAVRAASRAAFYLPVVSLIGVFGTVLALYFGGQEVAEVLKDPMAIGMSAGTLVAFFQYTQKFFQPVQDIARRFTDFQNAQAAIERIFSLQETEPEIGDRADLAAPPATLKGAVSFKNMNFRYVPEVPLLDDFNLEITAGSSVALVGETGSGKTTIASLLARYYQPQSGELCIDGKDYRHYPLRWLQSRIGVVLQTPFLFKGSIRDNITYGVDEATDEAVEKAARLANAHEFISQLEGGYDYQLGEGGSGLSVGQKQLVTLARTVLINPDILILDEATASIDTHTEKLIQEAIAQIIHSRTSLVIAHRLSTIREADLIVVMSHGKIIEKGTHDELMAMEGHYRKLYLTQRVKEEEKAMHF